MKSQKIIVKLIILILIIVFFYFSYKILSYIINYHNTLDNLEKINDNVNINKITDENANQFIDVDIEKLKELNSDSVAWIKVNNTNISYPVVQTIDNSYYLNHSYDKSKNNSGWVFLDYRNNALFNNQNNIIYAHARYDKTMFGTLKYVLEDDWLSDSSNYLIQISTQDSNTLWQVFSVYTIKTTSDYLQIEFSSDEEFLDFANMLVNRSIYDFNTTIEKEDKILTLSTCHNNTQRVVLHAKLIKSSSKN